MKKVSIIVPCYNAEKIIDRCVNQLVHQTLGLENIEIILVNDASTDGTIERLKQWEKQYPDSVLLIDSTVNMKTGGARNLGIRYASGEYVGFVDNDDWVDTTMYEKMYTAAHENDCDVVAVLYAREREDGYRFPFQMPKGKKNIRVDATKPRPEGVSPMPGEVWSKIYRRSMIVENNLFFPEGLSYPENYFGPLLGYYIKSYYVVDEILYHYIKYEHSIILSGRNDDIKDRLEIERRLLREIQERGIDDIHSDRMMKNFLQRYYINTLYLCFRDSRTGMPYEVFYKMKEEVLSVYPEYYKSQAVQELCQNSANAFLLRTLEVCMTDALWDRVAEEYMNEHFDLSVFLRAKRDERVPESIERREIFKLGYFLFCEIRETVKNLRLAIEDTWKEEVWISYGRLISKRIEEAGVLADVIAEQYRFEWKPYQEETRESFWQEAFTAFQEGRQEDGQEALGKMDAYLELPQDLYKMLWCRGEMNVLQFMPALEYCFLHANDAELLSHARKIIFDGRSPIFSFPYEETVYDTEISFDAEAGMFYYVQDGIRLYIPRDKISTIEDMEHIVYELLVEQDPRSPHRYLNERMDVQEGAVVIDAGVAEGNFSASVLQKCRKLYMVECDQNYVEALKVSFKEYMDKIVIVDKYLDSYDDGEHITIDTLLNGEKADYIKMDIEGSEVAALQGAGQTLKNSPGLKCNICSYHNLHDYEAITEILSQYDMEIEPSPGYIFFSADKEYPSYPRRGLVQAVKL